MSPVHQVWPKPNAQRREETSVLFMHARTQTYTKTHTRRHKRAPHTHTPTHVKLKWARGCHFDLRLSRNPWFNPGETRIKRCALSFSLVETPDWMSIIKSSQVNSSQAVLYHQIFLNWKVCVPHIVEKKKKRRRRKKTHNISLKHTLYLQNMISYSRSLLCMRMKSVSELCASGLTIWNNGQFEIEEK